MRYLFVLLGFLLSSCSYNLALYPRGGAGEVVRGTGNSMNETMEVTLRGETYRGRYIQGTSTGVGFASGGRGLSTMTVVSSSNQFGAVLTSGNKALRCDFMADTMGGNGVCVDSTNTTYDLVITPQ